MIWKSLNSFEQVIDNYYEVSEYGDIRIINSGELIKLRIKKFKKGKCYYIASLLTVDEYFDRFLVHRIVAHVFNEIPEKYRNKNVYLVPDHLDNNGLNNYYKNLEWKTRGENTSDAFKMGYINNTGENHKGSLISNSQAEFICKLLSEGKHYSDILTIMNLPANQEKYRRLLVRIKCGLAYKDISKKYNLDNIGYMYTDNVMPRVKLVPYVRQLLLTDLSNKEIVNYLRYNDYTTEPYDKLMRFVQDIRMNRSYKNII